MEIIKHYASSKGEAMERAHRMTLEAAQFGYESSIGHNMRNFAVIVKIGGGTLDAVQTIIFYPEPLDTIRLPAIINSGHNRRSSDVK